MDPLTLGMLAMSAGSMVHNIDKENRDRQLAAATQRYSPWTGLKAQGVEAANPFGDLSQGGAAALGYEQKKKQADQQGAYMAAVTNAINGGKTNPYSASRIRGYNTMADPGMGTNGSITPMGMTDYGAYGVG